MTTRAVVISLTANSDVQSVETQRKYETGFRVNQRRRHEHFDFGPKLRDSAELCRLVPFILLKLAQEQSGAAPYPASSQSQTNYHPMKLSSEHTMIIVCLGHLPFTEHLCTSYLGHCYMLRNTRD